MTCNWDKLNRSIGVDEGKLARNVMFQNRQSTAAILNQDEPKEEILDDELGVLWSYTYYFDLF